jgi:predicted transcriptional regulator
METTLSVINQLPSDKASVAMFVRSIKAEILANDKNPLPILVQLKMAEKTIGEILKDDDIDEHFLKEFLQYDKDEKVIVSGATLTSSETGVKYHFDDCGDQVYNDLMKESEALKEKIKEREAYLKNLPKEGTVCPIHGNFINRPAKSSKTKVIVKLQ